jgi:hypothetical protein
VTVAEKKEEVAESAPAAAAAPADTAAAPVKKARGRPKKEVRMQRILMGNACSTEWSFSYVSKQPNAACLRSQGGPATPKKVPSGRPRGRPPKLVRSHAIFLFSFIAMHVTNISLSFLSYKSHV